MTHEAHKMETHEQSILEKKNIANLLPFHRNILTEIYDPQSSELLLLARGLGLRKLICNLLQVYESPQNLVLLVNATPEEEAGIGEELGIMGCLRPGLRTVAYEMPKKERRVKPLHSREFSMTMVKTGSIQTWRVDICHFTYSRGRLATI